MTTLLERKKELMTNKTSYMEVVGNNRITYRVTTALVRNKEEEYYTYGIEAEKVIGPIHIKESIDDFSRDLKKAVGFAEMLLKYNIKPSLIYNAALCFLYENM